MAGPGVTLAEVDLSTRVDSTVGVYGGIVIAATKGPVGKATLVTNDSQLLSRYTPNGTVEVGMSNGYWSARSFLQRSTTLYVVRAANNPLYGSAYLRRLGADKDNGSGEFGFADPTSYDMETTNGRPLITPTTITNDIIVSPTNIIVDATFYTLVQTGDTIVFSTEEGTLPEPLVAGTIYYAIKGTTRNTIQVAATAQDAVSGTAITLTSGYEGLVTLSDTAVAAEEATEMKSVIIYGANEGDWNNQVFIKVYPYRTQETITFENSEIVVSQDWEPGEAVRLSTTGALPEGLDTTLTYYITTGSDATSRKLSTTIQNALDGVAIGWEGDSTGTSYLTPVDARTREPDTFAIEVYTDQNLSNPIETWIVSRDPQKKDGNNRNVFIENVLEGSNYIRGLSNTTVDGSVQPKGQYTLLALSGGDDGAPVGDAAMINALQAFSSIDEVTLKCIMDGDWTTPAFQRAILEIAETRKDCVGILSTPFEEEEKADYINAIQDYRNLTLNANSSFGALYSPHVQIYDVDNDRDIYVAPDGFVCAAMSDTAVNQEIWYPVAGFRRGVLNVLDVRRRFTTDRAGGGEIGILYDDGINCIRFAPGRGIVIWGQKTLSSRPSSLDRLNVRLLLTVIEPDIANALEDYIFQLNDTAERALIVAMIESYMDNIKARRGVYDYMVVCDETNNSQEDIDNKRLNVWLFVKPTQAIEFIKFTTVITRSDADFNVSVTAV